MYFIANCPIGYREMHGYIHGLDTSLGPALDSLNGKECAKKCSENPECKSFEHNNTALKCSLNTAAKPSIIPKVPADPSIVVYKDYVFCSKMGNVKFINFLIHSRAR